MMLGSGEGMGILMPFHLTHSAAETEMAVANGGGSVVRAKEDRVPQWSHQETRDFLAIRGGLEGDFTVSKRNKTLWEVVAARMKERGHRRSPDQCKCKWKNLVNRYKGKETSDPENGRQCPFFDELHAIFTERARSMQRLFLESETGTTSHLKKKLKRPSGDKSTDEFSDDEEDEVDSGDVQQLIRSKKKKPDKAQLQQRATDKSKAGNNGVRELIQDFFQQQQHTEAVWWEILERRSQERQIFEQDWRQSMEKLERERMMMEQAWQQREEQRRIREESQAMKRDALLTTLLDRLIHENL